MTSYDVCKKNWQRILVGDPEQLKNGDETVKARVTACENKALKAWNLYKENGKKPETCMPTSTMETIRIAWAEVASADKGGERVKL